MNAVKVKDNIYWVGAVDFNIRNFHGYTTENGATYNAYLIIDEKITLIDCVKKEFSDELLSRISNIIDPAKIDYIICNHVEMDHSGALPQVLKAAPKAEVVCTSPQGVKELAIHYGINVKNGVKAGDELNIGKHNLKFVPTPMLHWPDNMVTYCPEANILFSNDAFGQHYSSEERFEDDQNREALFIDAKKYYCNILMPYRAQAAKAVEIVRGLDIDTIAPSHGLIIQESIERMLNCYDEWSTTPGDGSALVVYDSMWHSTETMARSIAEAFREKGVRVHLYDLKHWHPSQFMDRILDASILAVGSPTLNSQMLPTVAAFLCYLAGLTPKGRKAFAFGSYGWSAVGINNVSKQLEVCKYEIIHEPIAINFIPDEKALVTLKEEIKAL